MTEASDAVPRHVGRNSVIVLLLTGVALLPMALPRAFAPNPGRGAFLALAGTLIALLIPGVAGLIRSGLVSHRYFVFFNRS